MLVLVSGTESGRNQVGAWCAAGSRLTPQRHAPPALPYQRFTAMVGIMVRAVLLIMVLTLPASACLNDSEIAHAEGEFRARYAGGTSAASGAQTTLIVLALGLASGVGGLLWWRWVRRG